MNLSQKLRARDVVRWHIVRTARHQSLAEHMWSVTIIALHITDLLGLDEDARRRVLEYALTHDLAEVMLGDIPTPTKEALSEKARAEIDNLSTYMTGGLVAELSSEFPLIRAIVKLADYLEAWTFLRQEGLGVHAESVCQYMRDHVTLAFDNLMKMVSVDAKWPMSEMMLDLEVGAQEDRNART